MLSRPDREIFGDVVACAGDGGSVFNLGRDHEVAASALKTGPDRTTFGGLGCGNRRPDRVACFDTALTMPRLLRRSVAEVIDV